MATVDKNFKIKNGLIVGDSTNLVNYSSASPSNPFLGQLWINEPYLYAWSSASTWVLIGDGTASGGGGGAIEEVFYQTTAPVSPAVGDIWIDSDSDIEAASIAINDLLPSQTGNNGKYLKTDGSNTSWSSIDLSAYILVSASSAIVANYIPITSSQTYLTRSDANIIYAPLASASLTGTPTAPTASPTTNTQQIATTEFVRTEVSNLIASAPATLDTLNELASALGNDSNFATSTASAIGQRLLASTASTLYMSIGTTANHASTASSINWTGVTGTPTTLSGYGITDALPVSASINYLNINTASTIYLKVDTASATYLPISATATLNSGAGYARSFLLGGL